MQTNATAEVGVRIVRRQRQSTVATGNRIVPAPQFQQGASTIGKRRCIVGLQRDGFVVAGQCCSMLLQCAQGIATVGVEVWVTRKQLDGFAYDVRSPLKVARLGRNHTQQMHRLVVLWLHRQNSLI